MDRRYLVFHLALQCDNPTCDNYEVIQDVGAYSESDTGMVIPSKESCELCGNTLRQVL